MSGVNKVILIGHLGRDPESRSTSSGGRVVSLSVATGETWRDKTTGERKQRTEWHRVVIFNEQIAKVAEDYLKKGSRLYIEGQLGTRKYTDRDGIEKSVTEVVLTQDRGALTLLDGGERPAADADSYGTTTTRPPAGGSAASAGGFDDEVPL